MSESMRGDIGALAVELDASSSQPTAKLLAESISRLKTAPVSNVASGPLGHLFPVPVLDHTGPFRLVCEIASGGMATMHLGINRGVAGFEKFVAIKRIHPHLAQAKEFYEMFVDEARIAARVDHPYVCRVFDFGRAEQSYYIAMEFLHGEPLSKVLSCAGEKNLHQPCFPHIAARIVSNLAEGLHAVHSLCDASGRNLEVIHRDVTPQNLFVLYDGTVRVTDFGIARARQREHETQGGRLKGTLAYMAPEQLKRGDIDQGVDIWALGAVLWEMLTARKLFRCSNEGETVMDVLSREIVAPSRFNAHVSHELDQIVLRALARNRNERYASAAELSRALEQYLTHSGDSVLAMDVAEWLSGLFPTGKERGRDLLELARAAAEELPRFAASDAPEPRAPARDSVGSLSAIAMAIDETRTESILPAPAPTPAEPRLPPQLLDRVVGLALISGTVLLGLGLSFVGRSSSTPAPTAAHAASLAPRPGTWSPSQSNVRSAGPPNIPERKPDPPSSSPRPPTLHRRVAQRPSSPLPPPATAKSETLPTGSVFVATPGVTANVFEAGRALGRTPQQLELSPGSHSLMLTSQNGSRTVLVDVKAGSATVLSLSLAEAPNDMPVSSAR